MLYTDEYGLEAPEHGWLPTPSYIMLRSALLDILDGMREGIFLEIGCGCGAFSLDLARRGYTGVAVEESPVPREAASHILAESEGVRLSGELPHKSVPRFDYVFSLHGMDSFASDEEQQAALRRWGTFLRPGGKLVVAAQGKRAGKAQAARRYDRRELLAGLRMAGYRVRKVYSAGFPLGYAMGPARWLLGKWRPAEADGGPAIPGAADARLARLYPLYSNIVSRIAFAMVMHAQSLVLECDLGTEYIAIADIFD